MIEMKSQAEKKTENENAELASKLMREFNYLYSSRGVWESHWEEIAQRILPSASQSFQNNFRTPGDKRTFQLFDSTAALALNRFAAILDSLLTPRNQKWHLLITDNNLLDKNRDVQLYFEKVNDLLFKYRYAESANFASQNQQNYTSLGAFGTGCMFIDELYGDKGIRYRNIHLGELYIAENHQGVVDKVFRRFKYTARQAMQVIEWKNTLPESIMKAAIDFPEREFEFIHCVRPREDLDPTRKDFKGMRWASYYITKENQTMLEESGYKTFPYPVSRYEQALGEVYGRGPAMDVLPAVKTLNEEKKTILKAGHRMVDPVLLAHDDGVISAFNLTPGAVNYGGVNASGQPLVHPLQTGNIQVQKLLMDDERKLINDAFLVSIFQILTENPQMTATEVMERTREKGILLAPTIGRQQSEYLGPMIQRELDVLAKQHMLPPIPNYLRDAAGDYKIQYESPITRTQRAEEVAGISRTIESILPVVQITQDPAPLDFLDWDAIVPEVAGINGVPIRWLKTLEGVQTLRQGRAQQAQAQQAIQAAPAAASVIKATAGQKG